MVNAASAKAHLFGITKNQEKTNSRSNGKTNRRRKDFIEYGATTRQLPSGKRLSRIEFSRRWGCLVYGPFAIFQNNHLPAKGSFLATLADLLFIRPNDLASLYVHSIKSELVEHRAHVAAGCGNGRKATEEHVLRTKLTP